MQFHTTFEPNENYNEKKIILIQEVLKIKCMYIKFFFSMLYISKFKYNNSNRK